MTSFRVHLLLIAAIALAASSAVGAPPDTAPTGRPASTSDSGSAAAPGPSGAGAVAARRDALLEALGSADRPRIERAVVALEEPGSDADPDVMFAAARACEDKLDDPGRAMALYDRIAAEHPAARVAAAAGRRVEALRPLVGPHGESAALAKRLARLIAHADAGPAEAVIREGEALAAAAWPGAPRAALWLADWLRRSGRVADAAARYEVVLARWPQGPEARAALRGAAGCALDAHEWGRAETIAARLPADDPADRGIRDDLLAAARRGRRRVRWYIAAWVALVAAFAGLLASLGETIARTPPGARRAALRPPIEAVFLAPVAAVLTGVAFTAHRLIAPAVAAISIGGVALTWLSGATLEQLRAAGRPRRLRVVAHVVACLVGVAALVYIAMTRDNLVDALLETVRFGPDV